MAPQVNGAQALVIQLLEKLQQVHSLTSVSLPSNEMLPVVLDRATRSTEMLNNVLGLLIGLGTTCVA